MQVIPALDVRGGQVVRLLRGDFGQERAYAVDPVGRAREYAAAGARRLHLVDLDAAAGAGSNHDLVRAVVAGSGLEVQVAGGIRDEAGASGWLEAGAAAVVMGTTAVRDPELLRRCAAAQPGRVLAALDLREGRPAVTGWTAVEATPLDALLARWEEAALAGVVLTSIDRDGTLEGPDLDALARVRAATRHPVTYSGGVAGLADLDRLGEAGAAAVILGKSLLEGRFTAAEAIARCAAAS